jgi:hypothetical protein
LPIYSSRSIDPEYIDETDSLYLGNLEVDLSDIAGGREREVLVDIFFGGTDIQPVPITTNKYKYIKIIISSIYNNVT